MLLDDLESFDFDDGLPMSCKTSILRDIYLKFKEQSAYPKDMDLKELNYIARKLSDYVTEEMTKRAELPYDPEVSPEEKEFMQLACSFFSDVIDFYQNNDFDVEKELNDKGIKLNGLDKEVKDELVKQRLKDIVPEVDIGWHRQELRILINRKLYIASDYLRQGFPQSTEAAVNYAERLISRAQAGLLEEEYFSEVYETVIGMYEDIEKEYTRMGIKKKEPEKKDALMVYDPRFSGDMPITSVRKRYTDDEKGMEEIRKQANRTLFEAYIYIKEGFYQSAQSAINMAKDMVTDVPSEFFMNNMFGEVWNKIGELEEIISKEYYLN